MRGPCRSARDCALESACFANTGTCAPVPTADCVPPTDEGGPNPRLALCNAASACAQGLTCVPLTQVLGPSGAYDAGPNGVCLTACNPCTPTECWLGETCFARTPGRGFCALGLLAEGAPCGYAVTPAPCAAGLTCAEVFEQAGRTCVRHCRPDAAAEVSAHADHSASTERGLPCRRSLLRNRLELSSRDAHRFRVYQSAHSSTMAGLAAAIATAGRRRPASPACARFELVATRPRPGPGAVYRSCWVHV